MPDHIETVYLYYWLASKKELRCYAGTIDHEDFIREGTTRKWFTVSNKEGNIMKSNSISNGAVKNFWFWLRTDNRLLATQIIMNYFNSIIRDIEESKSNALTLLTANFSDTIMEDDNCQYITKGEKDGKNYI